jgi:outer membrane lipoprotein
MQITNVSPRSSAASDAGAARFVLVAGLLCALAGCASVPKPLQGNFSPLTPLAATQRDATGEVVRWGGTLAVLEPLAGQTCFQIVGRPLSERSRPIASDRPGGRFIACRQGFYEPQIFTAGRSITVTGHVAGYETRRVGEYDFRQPKVAADVIYLWPKVEYATMY